MLYARCYMSHILLLLVKNFRVRSMLQWIFLLCFFTIVCMNKYRCVCYVSIVTVFDVLLFKSKNILNSCAQVILDVWGKQQLFYQILLDLNKDKNCWYNLYEYNKYTRTTPIVAKSFQKDFKIILIFYIPCVTILKEFCNMSYEILQ